MFPCSLRDHHVMAVVSRAAVAAACFLMAVRRTAAPLCVSVRRVIEVVVRPLLMGVCGWTVIGFLTRTEKKEKRDNEPLS